MNHCKKCVLVIADPARLDIYRTRNHATIIVAEDECEALEEIERNPHITHVWWRVHQLEYEIESRISSLLRKTNHLKAA